MESRALLFPKGVMYQIVCKANEYALSIEDPVSPKRSRIIGCRSDPQNCGQLWFIQQIKNADFQIVNAFCSYCFDEEKGEIRLLKGKQKGDQLFSLEKVPMEGYYDYYWIKTQSNGSKAVCLQGILCYKNFDQKDESQMFRFQPVLTNDTLEKTAIMVNVASGKVADVPEASRKAGVGIIQYSRNRRFNQRWVFEKAEKGIIIRNFNSKLVLDVEGQSKKPGTRIVQWTDTGKTNQLWKFQDKGDHTFIIRSVHQPKLTLGISDGSVNDMAKLVVAKHETIWHLEGKLPPYEL